LRNIVSCYGKTGKYEDRFINIPSGLCIDLNDCFTLEEALIAVKELDKYIQYDNKMWKSTFMESLLNEVQIKKWVDVEVKYFDLLKQSINKPSVVTSLNEELEIFKSKFLAYLNQDLSQKEIVLNEQLFHQFEQKVMTSEVIQNTIESDIVPSKTVLLNFNYTDIALKYISHFKKNWTYIPIHGELDGDDIIKQSPIFGFGDELDRDYVEFEHQNDDSLFYHIKSFKYLQFSHYRKLLDFIEDDPYQIFIFGHSCGVSDRTLLNTLF